MVEASRGESALLSPADRRLGNVATQSRGQSISYILSSVLSELTCKNGGIAKW